MTNEDDEAVAAIIASLKEINEVEEQIIKYSRSVLEEENGVVDFVDDKIRRLFRLASTYNAIFRKHDVTTREGFERVIRKHFRHTEVRHLHDDIVDNEDEWDSILQEVDKSLVADTGNLLKVGEQGPIDFELSDVRTGQSLTLGNILSEDEGKHLVLVLLRHFA